MTVDVVISEVDALIHCTKQGRKTCALWGLVGTRESIRLQSRCRTDQGQYN